MRKAEALNRPRTIREQIRKVTVMMQEQAPRPDPGSYSGGQRRDNQRRDRYGAR